jgi:transmembrane sensor
LAELPAEKCLENDKDKIAPMKLPDTDGIPDPDTLQEEARIWLSRLAVGEVTQMDVQAFKRWQRSSPAHQAAFEEVKRQWQTMKPALGDLLRSEPKIAARHARLLHGSASHPGRRAFLGAAVSAVAVAGIAGIAIVHPPLGLWPSAAEWDADERTATGEQRTLTLAQASITLNTQSSLRRSTEDGKLVGIELIAGEAAIDLAPGGKVFSVVAGAGRSLADSGRFEVRHLDNSKVCVTCIEGSVRLEHPVGMRLLQARQQMIYDADSVSSVAGVEPAEVSAWRKGELIFRQTPLVRVVDEINRYRSGRVVLMATAKRNNAVSGRFAIGTLDEALLQIQRSFDLNARSLPGGVLILS